MTKARDDGKKPRAAKKAPAKKKPVRASAAKESTRESSPLEREGAEDDRPLVLVVDDYQDAREMCCEYLAFTGYRVAEAKTGNEALEQAFKLLPDCILMDLSLPGMDGWEATRRLKADPRTKSIPVVALTGHALTGHSEGARDAGCDSFLTKPCLPDAMVDEVKRMLELRKKSRAKNGG